GNVDIDGTGTTVNINNCYLTLSGSGGAATTVAQYIDMDGIADGGTYLTITGSDWSTYLFDNWGFKDITGGSAEVTVNMNNAAVSATMTNYDTTAGYIGGEASDLDTAGDINWTATAAMIMEFNGAPFSNKEGIVLHWKTATEDFNQGFHIYRCEVKNINRKLPEFRLRKPSKKWHRVNKEILTGKGDSTDIEEYAVVDKTVKPGRNYVYLLVDVDVGNNPSVRTAPIRISLKKPESKSLLKTISVVDTEKIIKKASAYNIFSEAADNTWRWTAAGILLTGALAIALQKKHRRKAVIPATLALIVLSSIVIVSNSRKNLNVDIKDEVITNKKPVIPGIDYKQLSLTESGMQLNVMSGNASTPMAVVSLPADASLEQFANAIEQSYGSIKDLAGKGGDHSSDGRNIRLFPAITDEEEGEEPELLAIAEEIEMPEEEEIIEIPELEEVAEEEVKVPKVVLPPLKPSDDDDDKSREWQGPPVVIHTNDNNNGDDDNDVNPGPVDPGPGPVLTKPGDDDDDDYNPPLPSKPLPPASKYFVEPTLTKTMRITTDKEGLHLLTINQLHMAGFDFSKKFSLTNKGKEVKFWRIAPSQPSEAAMMTNNHCDIVFYAELHKDRYTANNIYVLRQYQVGLIEVSESRNKIGDPDSEIKYANYTPVYETVSVDPVSESINQAVTGTPIASPHFEKNSIAEENTWYRQNLTNGKADEARWYYLWPKAVSAAPFDLDIECDKVVTTEKGTVTAVLRSWAATSPASHIRISVNGTAVSDFEWDGARTVELTAEIPENILVEGTNTVNFFSFQDTPAGAGERDLIDWVKITYRRELEAKDNQLQFKADTGSSGTVTAAGFDDEKVFGISITSSGSQSVIDKINMAPDGPNFKATFNTLPGRKYLVSTIDGMHNPTLIEAAVEPVDMRTLTADYIIVCADGLKNVAYHYAWHHNQQGLDTKVFTLTEALDAANFGIYSPAAISNLVEEAGASYLLLLGDMTYDYFSRNNTEVDFAVPSWLISTQGFESVSDSAFAYARNSSGRPLVSVGRIPARTEAEAFTVLDKIRARVGMAQQPTELTVAAEGTSDQFKRIADNAAAQTGGTVVKAYEADLGVTEAHAALRRAWNNGTNNIFFAGHGSKHLWSNNSLMTTQLVPGLAERDVLPIVIQLNCQSNAAYFTHDATGYSCIGEALIMTPKKGASAVIGSTGTTAPESQEKLGVRTLYYLNNGTARVGDAFRKAMTDVLNDKPDAQVLNSFILLGDPASE
ncbi:MAG: C25 family cysteine peptidase, partial [Planctomycetota bacterium]